MKIPAYVTIVTVLFLYFYRTIKHDNDPIDQSIQI